MRLAIVDAELAIRNPIRGTLFGCCAWAIEAVMKKTVAPMQIRILLITSLFLSAELINDATHSTSAVDFS